MTWPNHRYFVIIIIRYVYSVCRVSCMCVLPATHSPSLQSRTNQCKETYQQYRINALTLHLLAIQIRFWRQMCWTWRWIFLFSSLSKLLLLILDILKAAWSSSTPVYLIMQPVFTLFINDRITFFWIYCCCRGHSTCPPPCSCGSEEETEKTKKTHFHNIQRHKHTARLSFNYSYIWCRWEWNFRGLFLAHTHKCMNTNIAVDHWWMEWMLNLYCIFVWRSNIFMNMLAGTKITGMIPWYLRVCIAKREWVQSTLQCWMQWTCCLAFVCQLWWRRLYLWALGCVELVQDIFKSQKHIIYIFESRTSSEISCAFDKFCWFVSNLKITYTHILLG